MSYLSGAQLSKIGFAKIGKDVLVSEHASVYNPGNIQIGNSVRIDDFSILSAGNGGITIGNYVHIAAGSMLFGDCNITMGDFSGLSSRVCVYSSSDDYSGTCLTNPTVPKDLRNVISNPVTLGRHVIIGTGSVIMPGVVLEDGCAIGALSLVSKRCEAFKIYAGNPARFIKTRSRDFLALEFMLAEDS